MTKENAASGFDLEKLDTSGRANLGFEVTIYNPKTMQETEIVITILGQDSEKFLEVQRKQAAKQLNTTMKGGPRREERLVEVTEDNVPTMLAATTLGWTGVLKDGKPFEFTPDNAKWLYKNYPIIRDQVLEAQRDRANFLVS